MSDVFANGNAIACKAGDGKVIAAFPDVCLSPPSPPAGPIPIPYPNTSFSKDMKNGSKTVKIGRKEVMLKDKSFYKTSPLGDEPATRSFGGSVITHTITGKTYFVAWSMDVKFEGDNVDRNLDLTTSNHNPYPGSTPPNPDIDKALERLASPTPLCPCCGQPRHAGQTGQAFHRDEWYEDCMKRKRDASIARRTKKWNDKMAGKTSEKSKAKDQASLDKEVAGINADHAQELADYQALVKKAEDRPNCICPAPRPDILPKPPCDVFFESPAAAADRKQRTTDLDRAWMDHKAAAFNQAPADRPAPLQTMQDGDKYMHKTPKAAGGCPTAEGNLQRKADLCGPCQKIDDDFNNFQNGWPD